ncbi:DUF916 and DUF3324 domain-containing protein [Latilactobacillus sakei]|uniref:DUF916 and DUF3324 domain-containing protein n=1 Tax=Latilactobacillus sakei TaxID=1599 RepID=UPI003F537E6F
MLKKRNLIAVLSMMALLVGIGMGLHPAQAADGAEFTITPVYGAGQSDKAAGYFSITAKPGESYPLTVNVQNLNTKQANDFDAQVVKASTSNSGTIDYGVSTQKMTKTKAPFLPDLVSKATRKQSITLEPGASKNVTFQVKVPEKGFKGLILGSVYVKRTSTHQTTPKKSFGIQNAFAMTVPVLISQDLNNRPTPKVVLTSAKLVASSGVPQVTGRIANTAPTMFGKIKINAWVTKRGQTKKLYQKKADKYEMAPRSTFLYSIDTNNQLLPVGRYTMHVKMTSGKKTFNSKHNFTVDGAAREKVNQQLNNPEKPGPNWWLWGSLIALLILVVALIAYLVGRKRGVGNHDA